MNVGKVVVISIIITGVPLVICVFQSQTTTIQSESKTKPSVDVSTQEGNTLDKGTVLPSLEDRIKYESVNESGSTMVDLFDRLLSVDTTDEDNKHTITLNYYRHKFYNRTGSFT